MDDKQYMRDAKATLSHKFFVDDVPTQLLHAAIGMVTEAGEYLDAIKKTLFYGKKLDKTNLIEELGDQMWYIIIACDALGVDLSHICDINIKKLKARYPEKFLTHDALNRNLDKEREILEGGE